jgi:hypothetical protein
MARRSKIIPTKIKATQIEVDEDIQRESQTWQLTDKALHELNDYYKWPDFDAYLIKVAAVNASYSTYVPAIDQIAAHVRRTTKF